MTEYVNNSGNMPSTSGYVFVPNDNSYVPPTTAPVVPIQYVYPLPGYPAVCPGCGREKEFKITYSSGQTLS